jgi:hypothetical protein
MALLQPPRRVFALAPAVPAENFASCDKKICSNKGYY